MSAARSSVTGCRWTPGCLGEGDHVCATPAPPPSSRMTPEDERALREARREALRRAFRVTL